MLQYQITLTIMYIIDIKNNTLSYIRPLNIFYVGYNYKM